MRATTIATVPAVLGAAPAAAAGDAAAGKARSAVCAGCHGVDGNSTDARWPKLAGQHEAYLVVALRAYRSGARRAGAMNAMAAPLSDADIDDLAAWYASQRQK